MNTPKCSLLVLAAATALASVGCGDANGPSAEESVATNGTSPLVDWDTFRASAREIPNEGFLVEFDLLFRTEEDLYAYWQKEYAGGPGEALTVWQITIDGQRVDNLWSYSQRFDITYCVNSTGFTSAQMSALLPALDAAAEAWHSFLAVRFKRVTVSGTCDENNNQVIFNIRGHNFTEAFLPYEPRVDRILNLHATGTSNAFTNDNTLGVDLLGTLTHEFGHALGFPHEHVWNPTCSADEFQTGIVKDNSRQVTEYDQMSVMNHPMIGCRDPIGGGYHISPLDVRGSVSLYGLAPALVDTVASSLLD
jgi:hypothetical protein